MKFKEKIRIVFISRRPRKFGNFSLEIYFKNIIQELSKENLEIKKITLPFTSDGIFNRLFNIIFCFFIQGDLYHLTGDINYVSLLLPKRKTITTIPDCARAASLNGLRKKLYIFLWLKIPVFKSKIITTISQFSKDEIIKYTKCKDNKVEILPVSLNPIFKRKEKLFNENKPRILQIGTQVNKNVERVIEAISDVPCLFVIVGKLSEEVINKLKFFNIQYLNFFNLTDDELKEQYEMCDIVTFVSTIEGFGVPIIEANAIGRVVITSSISSMPEVANDSALFVDPYSVKSIRLGILEVLNDYKLREKLISNGFENSKKYDNKLIAFSHLDLYYKIFFNQGK